MIIQFFHDVILALFVAPLTVVVTKSQALEGFRLWWFSRARIVYTLLSCTFCMSWWLSALAVLVFQAIPASDAYYLVDTTVVVAISAPVTWLIYRSHKAIT